LYAEYSTVWDRQKVYINGPFNALETGFAKKKTRIKNAPKSFKLSLYKDLLGDQNTSAKVVGCVCVTDDWDIPSSEVNYMQ
jgi:hypothetical protein